MHGCENSCEIVHMLLHFGANCEVMYNINHEDPDASPRYISIMDIARLKNDAQLYHTIANNDKCRDLGKEFATIIQAENDMLEETETKTETETKM